MRTRVVVGAAALAAATLGWSATRVAAHVTVVSPFTFYRDVQPILERRCGACHGDGGVAPTALLQYGRRDCSRGRCDKSLISSVACRLGLPNRGAPASKRRKRSRRVELDVLMTWAAGGAPEGKPAD